MNGLGILELVIGVIFVYFLLSLICVALQEARSRFAKLRIENLKKWIVDTFNKGDKILGDRLWCNIIIDGLTQEQKASSYISREIFVNALLHEIHHGENTAPGKNQNYTTDFDPYTIHSIKNSITESSLLSDGFKRVLLQFHSESFSNLETFKVRIGRWFDEAMERNAGTYKKDAQHWILIFSFIITIAINVDSIKLIRYFYENKEEAKKVADAAEEMITDPRVVKTIEALKDTSRTNDKAQIDSIHQDVKAIKEYHAKLQSLGLPIGWTIAPDYGDASCLSIFLYWLKTVIGWFITGIAVSLGAPFWFDTLNKLVNLRSAGKRPEGLAEDKDSKPSDKAIA
jgi:hypothetical protein